MPWLGANGLLPGRGAPGRAGRGALPSPSRAAGASGVTVAGPSKTGLDGIGGEVTATAAGTCGAGATGAAVTGTAMTGAAVTVTGPGTTGAGAGAVGLAAELLAAGLVATSAAALALTSVAGALAAASSLGNVSRSCEPQGARWSRKPTDELALFLQMTEQNFALYSELFCELVDPDLSHVSPHLWPGRI